jgi:hypothetical protein
MRGTSRERHCDVCDKQVHNLERMTTVEIEALVTGAKGSLCAIITRRADGSLVRLDSRPKPSIAAGIVASASFAVTSVAVAQSVSTNQPQQAVLTGTVLTPDGSKPVNGAVITLKQQDATVVTTKSDAQGKFRIAARPGSYEIRIRQNVLFGNHVRDANLHVGEQILSAIRTHFDWHDNGQYATMGTVTATISYPVSYVLKHPWRYLGHLIRDA